MITIVSGSHRKNSQSVKVANYLKYQLEESGYKKEIQVIDLAEYEIPFWNEGVWENSQEWQESWAPVEDSLKESEGIVLISPEWAGMVTPKLKNLLLLCSSKIVAHKPALIATVSSGIGGSYSVAELRMTASKNNKMCFIPEHLIIRNCEKILNSNKSKDITEREAKLRTRIEYTLGVFIKYCDALKGFNIDVSEFPYGM